ncbi:hypothetical protein BSG1_04865 [Bacillus sp. SG-1]|nr:hypothetical protein BSG1_04865 [Bacillus sp. SG-1]
MDHILRGWLEIGLLFLKSVQVLHGEQEIRTNNFKTGLDQLNPAIKINHKNMKLSLVNNVSNYKHRRGEIQWSILTDSLTDSRKFTVCSGSYL